MKWSELPQEYTSLIKKDSWVIYNPESDVILDRIKVRHTPQGYLFWAKCQVAKTISQLPQIPKNDK